MSNNDNNLEYITLPVYNNNSINNNQTTIYTTYFESLEWNTEYNEINIDTIIFDNSTNLFLIYINDNDIIGNKGVVPGNYIKIDDNIYMIDYLDHDCNIIKIKLSNRTNKLMSYVPENYSTIPICRKSLYCNKTIKHNKIIDLTDDQIYLILKFKIDELKQIAIRNLVDFNKIENKTMKRSWARAITETKKYAFNIFVVNTIKNSEHLLNGHVDILLIIQSFM
tara:strand:+ start:481 stop:1149 length:669 start_codon:yes stop_codon:yes gene_type:complete